MAICDIDIMQWCHIEEDALDVKSSWGDSLGIVLVLILPIVYCKT